MQAETAALATGRGDRATGAEPLLSDSLPSARNENSAAGSDSGSDGVVTLTPQQAKAEFEAFLGSLSWWQRLGFRSQRAELGLYLLLLSGLTLWDQLSAPWPVARLALVAHSLLSVLLVPLLLLPFWLSHRRRLTASSRPFLRLSGQGLEVLFAVLLLSGLWLLLVGNRGDAAGGVARWSHLVTSLLTGVLVLVHSWRYSMVRRAGWMLALVLAALLLWSPARAEEPAPAASPAASPAAPATATPATATPAPAAPVFPAVSSATFLLDSDNNRLVSATFSAGSVSLVDPQSGKLLAETRTGGDIHAVALGPKTIAASDFTGGQVFLLDRQTLKLRQTVKTGGRPNGIVYDRRNGLFWVALFEDGQLLALTPDGDIRLRQPAGEAPRGLALLGDGRLVVTHSLTGEVSLWDTTSLPPRHLKTLTLAVEQHADQAVSQGKPRLLDEILVSPDQGEAWLPHVLWNFDHPFQFQSTVFPAVSLLSLLPGEEQEIASDRKQLFQQINILEEGSRTRIVSNPVSGAFSADGRRVYITAAGSEDLLVFDRSRASSITRSADERRSRRANKIDQGGAKVVQILRHLPGDNPRGIVLLGDSLFVQNAMSLDISRLSTGGSSSFARVSVSTDSFARLVEHDPLPPELRRGERLFHSANTDDFPGAPLTGDNWMSCQSCHYDGFNFTNSALFKATEHNKFDNAVTGHAGMKTMVATDFVGDYIRMIRDTQGGMGADTRFPTPDTRPEAPSPAVSAMMHDLHQYVTARQNLPFLSTWMKVEGADGSKKTVHPQDWGNPAACRECHSAMFDQWADSTHRLMGESNPYYMVVEALAGKLEGEPFRAWCMGCHQVQKLSSGWTASGQQGDKGNMFERGAASLRQAWADGKKGDLDEGTGCLMCHRITRIEDAGQNGGGNASLTVNLADRPAYIFENASSQPLHWLGERQINAKPDVHKDSYSQPFYKDAKLCATCHGEFSPGVGAVIVDTYGEWLASPFNRPDDPARNRTCIDCHMHGDIARIGQPVPGQSTDGGPVKANVVTHQFTGANHHLVGLRNEELARKSIQLLQSAATLESLVRPVTAPVTAPGAPPAGAPADVAAVSPAPGSGTDELVIRVINSGAGHALPTGVADFRELWLNITATDASGKVVVDSGKMTADGTVPADARFFRKVFGRTDGTPAGLAFWRHEKMLDDTRIPAGGQRDEAFALPADVQYPLTVDVRLMFRIYPKWVTDAVRQTYPELPEPLPVEMKRLTTTVQPGQGG